MTLNLPLRIHSDPGTAKVISVDGAFGAPGLNLSHWPGNTTPQELRHDLSTGSALLFAKLSETDKQNYAAGCTEICNNHVDTDGVCAMFAVAEPELALRFEEKLLKAAEAGDFFHPRDEESLVFDAIITACLDSERSPWRGETAALDENARHEFDVRRLVEILPTLLEGNLTDYDAIWKPVVEDWYSDQRDLEAAALDDLAHLDFCVWTSEVRSSRANAPTEHFDPSRQALNAKRLADRILVVGQVTAGCTFRFIVSTLSWFDQDGRACLPRPELAKLAAELNELEGSDPSSGEFAWHAHSDSGASPELWFGSAGLPSFPTHGGEFLTASKLDPQVVRSKVLAALRATWVFPE